MAGNKTVPKDLAYYDDEFFADMKDAYVHKEAHKWTQLRLRHIELLVEPKKNEKIIDLGCAAGAITHFCSTFGMQALGVDFSKKAIEIAKKTFKGKNISFLQRDVADLHGIKDNSFDKAVAADLVEHVPQEAFERMCMEVYRILRKGGSFSIYTPNPGHLVEIMKKHNFLVKQNPSHIALRTKAQLLKTLEKNGFRTEIAYYAASHFAPWNAFETVLKEIPGIGAFFGYRICIRAIKT